MFSLFVVVVVIAIIDVATFVKIIIFIFFLLNKCKESSRLSLRPIIEYASKNSKIQKKEREREEVKQAFLKQAFSPVRKDSCLKF